MGTGFGGVRRLGIMAALLLLSGCTLSWLPPPDPPCGSPQGGEGCWSMAERDADIMWQVGTVNFASSCTAVVNQAQSTCSAFDLATEFQFMTAGEPQCSCTRNDTAGLVNRRWKLGYACQVYYRCAPGAQPGRE